MQEINSKTYYEQLLKLAKSNRCRIEELLVLTRQNDPFYAGNSGAIVRARWFKSLWDQFGYDRGIHIRRMHYQIASIGDIAKPDGKIYQNTHTDWDYLNVASKDARYLGLVDPAAFIDRRNPDPHIFYFPGDTNQGPGWSPILPSFDIPSLGYELTAGLEWALPWFSINGYEYNESLQPYHIEIWAEKSTMDDILIPLCQDYAINLVTGVGFLSITSVINLLGRIAESKKPTLILYVSDFDPAGALMPISVARQIEYWLKVYSLSSRVQLDWVVLTQDQVGQYQLPRVPIKESDLRKGKFEIAYGEGAVELDALEALHPRELARILKNKISQYRDPKLSEKLKAAKTEAYNKLYAIWMDKIGPYREKVAAIRKVVEEILKGYQVELDALNEELQEELSPLQEQLNAVSLAVREIIDNLKVDLPPRPAPGTQRDGTDWLFDSSRDYWEQLESYKKWR